MNLDWNKILRHVPADLRDEARKAIEENYADVVTTNWPVTYEPEGENGRRVLRFKANRAIRFAVDAMGFKLNDLWSEARRNDWRLRELKLLYRGMGYSLSGFAEVFCDREGWRP